MPEKQSRLIKSLKRGGRLDRKPPGFSFLSKRLEPKDKLKVIRYVSGCRSALLTDLGGEQEISAGKLILVDRLCSLIAVIRGIETYYAEDIFTITGELRPALQKNYISYVNSVRLILTSLGLEKQTEQGSSIIEIIEEFDARIVTKDKAAKTDKGSS